MVLYERIQRSIDFIEDNLDHDINLADIAKASGFSLSHFYKIFCATTGFSVKEYVRNRRLSWASRQLVNTDHRIIDIAVEAGFNSHEVFTRAFLNLYGTSPNNYRINQRQSLPFEKIRLFGKTIEKKYRFRKDDIPIRVKICNSKELILIGMELQTSVCDTIERNTIPMFWQDRFLPKLAEVKYIKQPYISVGYEILNPETDALYHLACVESTAKIVPEGMVLRIIPATKYAVFSTNKALSPVEYGILVQYIYGEWLPMSGYETLFDYTIDMNYSNIYYSDRYYLLAQQTDSKLEVYIPIK